MIHDLIQVHLSHKKHRWNPIKEQRQQQMGHQWSRPLRSWIFLAPMGFLKTVSPQALLRFVPHIQQLDMESWETWIKDGEDDFPQGGPLLVIY